MTGESVVISPISFLILSPSTNVLFLLLCLSVLKCPFGSSLCLLFYGLGFLILYLLQKYSQLFMKQFYHDCFKIFVR